jgi:hypothetical protein
MHIWGSPYYITVRTTSLINIKINIRISWLHACGVGQKGKVPQNPSCIIIFPKSMATFRVSPHYIETNCIHYSLVKSRFIMTQSLFFAEIQHFCAGSSLCYLLMHQYGTNPHINGLV